MRLSVLLVFSALTAVSYSARIVSSAQRDSSAQHDPSSALTPEFLTERDYFGFNSEECAAFLRTLSGDTAAAHCIYVWSNILTLPNLQGPAYPETVKNIFAAGCTPRGPTPFPQAHVEAVAMRAADSCAANNAEWQSITFLGNLCTPVSKAVCYLDNDKEFVLAKDVLALKVDTNKRGFPFFFVENKNICTKGNQHLVGTILDFVKARPELSTYVATRWSSTWERILMREATRTCGADYANGLASATGPPYPEIQQMFEASYYPNTDDDTTGDSSLGNDAIREGKDNIRKPTENRRHPYIQSRLK